jgi:hypothetical protein
MELIFIGALSAAVVYLFATGRLGNATGANQAAQGYQVAQSSQPTNEQIATALDQNLSTQWQGGQAPTQSPSGQPSVTGAGSSVLSAAVTAAPFAAAAAVVGFAASVISAQHAANLKGAISENKLIPTTVQAFDADLQQLAKLFNAGKITKAQAAAYIAQMNANIYQFMRSNATAPTSAGSGSVLSIVGLGGGSPGRAWLDQPGKGLASTKPGASWPNAPLPCGKLCTAECCVYYSALNPVLGMLYQWFNEGPVGVNRNWGFFTGTLSNKTITATVLTVYPPTGQYAAMYGTFQRPAYNLTFTQP